MLDRVTAAPQPIRQPNAVDIDVGSRIKIRRKSLGMSQTTLGDSLGVTFQQIQKYEKGTNRVGASRLQHIATILGVQVSYFFESSDMAGDDRPAESELASFIRTPEGIKLNRAFASIKDAEARRKLAALVFAVAELGTAH